MNHFRTAALREMYDHSARAFWQKGPLLFAPDGRRCGGNGLASAFWRGFDGAEMRWDRASKRTFAYAAFRAGEDARRETSPDVVRRRVAIARAAEARAIIARAHREGEK